MYCKKCGQLLVVDNEKALNGQVQEVWRSNLTQEWCCKVDGNEHEPGSITDWARRVQRTLYGVQQMVEAEDISAEVALQVVLVDAGLAERSDFSIQLAEALRSDDPTELLKILEEADR